MPVGSVMTYTPFIHEVAEDLVVARDVFGIAVPRVLLVPRQAHAILRVERDQQVLRPHRDEREAQ